MGDTFVKKATSSKLEVTLKDFGIKQSNIHFIDRVDENTKVLLADLTIFTPTDQSNIGDKFTDFSSLTDKNLNSFVQKLVKALDVTPFFFKQYTSKKDSVEDLYSKVKNIRKPILLLYIGDNGLKKSLYANLRNSLAHGNILSFNNSIIIYSYAKKNNEKLKEEDKILSFFLRIHSIKKLQGFRSVLDEYKC